MNNFSPIISLCRREAPINAASRASRVSGALRAALLVAAGVCLLSVSAQIKVPYYPVPQTLQTLAVLLLPFLLGARPAIGAVVSYLALGAAGAPVFAAAAGGWAHFIGPTGGFLLGFLVAVAALSLCLHLRLVRGFASALLCLLVADALVFLCGIPWLALALGGDWQKAFTLGAAPFILGDLGKALLVAGAVALSQRQRRNA